MYDHLKWLAKKPFHLFGLDLVRRPAPDPPISPPPLLDCPLEALLRHQGGRRTAFECPLGKIIIPNGLSFGKQGYHPFTETVQEIHNDDITSYENSHLKVYYDTHKPHNAEESLINFDNTPKQFTNLPSYFFYLLPWISHSPHEFKNSIIDSLTDENEKVLKNYSIYTDDHQFNGPVSDRKGKFEFYRLYRTYKSIKNKGYDRTKGDISVKFLKYDDDYRCYMASGNHRTAVMDALGYDTVPVQFDRPRRILDIETVDYWPQVTNGIWTRSQAVKYFKFLFNLSPLTWAKNKELIC